LGGGGVTGLLRVVESLRITATQRFSVQSNDSRQAHQLDSDDFAFLTNTYVFDRWADALSKTRRLWYPVSERERAKTVPITASLSRYIQRRFEFQKLRNLTVMELRCSEFLPKPTVATRTSSEAAEPAVNPDSILWPLIAQLVTKDLTTQEIAFNIEQNLTNFQYDAIRKALSYAHPRCELFPSDLQSAKDLPTNFFTKLFQWAVISAKPVQEPWIIINEAELIDTKLIDDFLSGIYGSDETLHTRIFVAGLPVDKLRQATIGFLCIDKDTEYNGKDFSWPFFSL
jgi:hypothetical protein